MQKQKPKPNAYILQTEILDFILQKQVRNVKQSSRASYANGKLMALFSSVLGIISQTFEAKCVFKPHLDLSLTSF